MRNLIKIILLTQFYEVKILNLILSSLKTEIIIFVINFADDGRKKLIKVVIKTALNGSLLKVHSMHEPKFSWAWPNNKNMALEF